MLEKLLYFKTILIFIWLITFFTLEHIHPAVLIKYDKKHWHRIFKNLALWGCNILLSPLIVLPISKLATAHSFFHPFNAISNIPMNIAIQILCLDVAIYWWHRLNHEIPFLWRFHKIHHFDQMLDTSSALRFHFGEVILSAFARAILILFLGFSFKSVIIFETCVLINAIFHHSNIALPKTVEKILSYIIVTPSIHWVHHHITPQDTNSNYTNMLSIWDHVFFSRSKTMRTKNMLIGVDTQQDLSLFNLLKKPFT